MSLCGCYFRKHQMTGQQQLQHVDRLPRRKGKGRGGIVRGYSLKYDKMLFETFSVIDTPVSRRQREMNAVAG